MLDAIPIAELSKHRPLESVRLSEQHDAEVKDQTGTFDVEVTEVLEPGRKRGDEYRSGAPQVTHSAFDPNLGETIATALADGIKKKAEKNYAAKPLLLVYLNISTGGKFSDEVETKINELKAQYADKFREICVLWAGKLY
ncbi:hypothetical protein ABIF65_007915 [Bradyrhizobium japonicum]|uniref:Uncharacterized protein n=1 Tax=Bradyrhizobium barranii subsp. barranii TaxID=2823807 RepID=A0A939M0B5_9BRAD|nr:MULTISPECIES: hypothetical protein [Bradyrhizobium]MBR0882734.1 hypothetical protein [Bradyrhizobium liaoningense]MBR1004029.1 hypothetical protein [Bradyrhizobium liaoningense]MBR1070312.1 hypothetical protein [Bradyrhizobium liaoningense]MCP1773598.1 hypothetical protein [Bradyrhizobium japonicum]MCP1863858.1 hypothetical protein [Bradyrhizobium japonicum]